MLMSEAKRKVLACAMALAMALSMVNVTALKAFADEFTIGDLVLQSSDGSVVYDTAYGVMHGEYALMMKRVTYEREYEGRQTQFTTTITDLLNVSGEVTVHTSDAAEDDDAIPGPWANYRLVQGSARNSAGVNACNGFVKVSDKATGKVGVRKVDGTELMACVYSEVVQSGDALVGVTLSGDDAKVDFYDFDGANLGSFSFAAPDSAEGRYVYLHAYGNYVKATSVSYSDAGRIENGAWYRHDGGRFVQDDDVVRVYAESYSSSTPNAVVLSRTNGCVYYRDTDGKETELCPAEDVSSADLLNSGVITIKLQSGATCYYSTSSGARLGFLDNARSPEFWGDYIVDCISEWSATGFTYAVYDYEGNVAYTFKAFREGILRSSGLHYRVTGNSSAKTFKVGVFNNEDGSLVKDMGAVSSPSVDLSACYLNKHESSNNEVKTVLAGYRLANISDDSNRYFDEDFSEVARIPADSDVYELPDGQEVVVSCNWDGDMPVVTVADRDGGAVSLGGYTLAVALDSGDYSATNSVKHGNADLWWAVDEAGNWGAVSSSGEVLVPFVYESYYDLGLADTDYALVKKDGVWSFLRVASVVEESGISMHRLYNEWSGEHFYTSDDAEFEGLVALGWTDEGEGWKAPITSGTPVYRLYNPYAGEHHYTMDAAERDSMVDAGWTYEDVGWYSDDAQTVPLYREYNPFEFSNNHNYTTDAAEHEFLVSIGWVDEGYAWYGV